ncbi:ABC transporter substrate-binding protein [Georgenia subflava]|uniref:Probable sugar-binding periplasmic protein n=1 Tax=Georgenia subflava TaxID=1622177 RepID=A0A6N7EJD6_9MICO|nr:ABC transporter substrate-binding protein [Georgenia subflava]MPV36655.1 extracellular solute-binding protein [Georgenia subflava]
MRRIATVAGIAAASLVLAACGGGGGTEDGGDTDATGGGGGGGEVEVFTWWAQGSELAGLEALEAVFAEQHPDVEFVNGAVAGGAGSAAKDLLQTRLQAGDPPDTFQAHAGEELTDYIDAGQIEDVSYLYEEFGLTDVFPQDLIDLLTVDDAIYSVPSNIHRSNVVWANPTVLEEAGLDPASPPADIDAWMADLEAVEATGAVPLSVGMTWTQVHLLETVLMADLGAEAYIGLWTGETDWTGADVTAALEDFETLIGFTNTDRDGLDWPEATQMVIDGTAAYNVMGDWAVASFEEQEVERGTGFVEFPVPGSDGMFGFLADSFTLPVGAPNPEGAEAWLDTVGSLEGQVAFNKAKGSIPARTDADPAEFSEYQQSAIESYANDTIVPSLAHGAASPIAVLNAVSDATSKFTTGASDLAGFQEELAAAAGS